MAFILPSSWNSQFNHIMSTHLLLGNSLLGFSSFQNFLPPLSLHFPSLQMVVHSHWGVTGKDISAARVESQRPRVWGKPQIWDGDRCSLRVSTETRAGARHNGWCKIPVPRGRGGRCSYFWSLWEAKVMLRKRRRGWSWTSPGKSKAAC